MPPPSRPSLPKAAEPKYGRNFDPWNSVALGHQRAETKGPQGWRENRNWKLHSQLMAGNTGGSRLSDTVGAGSEDFDEEHQVLIPKEVKARAANSVVDMLRKPGTMSRSISPGTKAEARDDSKAIPSMPREKSVASQGTIFDNEDVDESSAATAAGLDGGDLTTTTITTTTTSNGSSKMFDGLVIYVNGSTHPLISDHKLKHLLVENGARMSIHLGRRQVTHVIIGRPSGPSSGAGGGLAGGKLEKEIRRVGGCGVKYVGVEW